MSVTKSFPLTMAPAKASAIFDTFTMTTQASREVRDSAERTIQQQYQTDPQFIFHLFEFLVVDPAVLLANIPSAQGNLKELQTAQKVVAVNFRNFILGRTFHSEYGAQTVRNPQTGIEEQKVVVTGSTRMPTDWRKNELILPQARLAIRNDLINALLTPTTTEFTRLQLLAVIEHVIGLELVSQFKAAPKKSKKSKKSGGAAEAVHEPWNDLIPALITELNNLAAHLQQLGAANAAKETVLVALSQQHILLRVLRLCCKRMTNMLEFNNESETEAFYNVAVPVAVQSLALSSAFLKQEYASMSAELAAHNASIDQTTAPHTAATNACAIADMTTKASSNLSELTSAEELFDAFGVNALQSSLIKELNAITYMSLKCLWPIVSIRTPRILCDASDGHGFDQLTTALIEAWRLRADLLYNTATVLGEAAPLVPVELQLSLSLRCAAASQTQAHRMSFNGNNNAMSAVEFSEVSRESHFWRLFKWIAKVMQNFQLHYGLRNRLHVDKAERPVAQRFLSTVATRFLPLVYAHIQWHHQPSEAVPSHRDILLASFTTRLSSPSAIRCVEYIETCIDTSSLYHSYILPTISTPLMTRYLYERLAYTEEDHEVWRENPEEYVRAQTGDNVMGTAITMRAVAMSCLLKFVTEAPPANPDAYAAATKAQKSTVNKKDPDGTAANLFYSYLNHLLAAFQKRVAARAAGSDTTEDQLAVDAAMYSIAEMRETMISRGSVPHSRIESIMTEFVFPELSATAPFLRARAVRLLSLFTRPKYMQWSSPEVYQHILKGALALLTDPQLPVRMQTCFYLSGFIQHPFAKPVVTPDIVRLVEQYFIMMKEMDSDRVIRTLRKTIHCYADTLSQWAVQLCEFLVQHFSNLYSLSLRKSAEQDSRDAINDCNADLDMLAAGGGGSKKGNNAAGGGQDIVEVLDAADELIETLRTLIDSLPKNEGATADPALAEVFAGIQRAVLPMVLHLLHAANPSYVALMNPSAAGKDNGEGTSFSFLDSLLGMVTLLIEQSNLVVPELWEIFSGLQGLVLYGGVADYFGSIIAPLDNAITVDVQGFLSHTGRSWKGVTLEAIASRQITSLEQLPQQPLAQLVRDMCDKVLLSEESHNTMRLSEMAAAPKIIECILLRIAIPPTDRPVAISEQQKQGAVSVLVPAVVQCAMSKPSESITFNYLLAMSVFAGLLVDSAATFAALTSCGLPIAQFFGHVVSVTTKFLSEALSEADGSGPQILQMRQLQIIAAVYTHMTHEATRAASASVSDANYVQLANGVVHALQPLIDSIVSVAGMQTQNMIAFAQDSIAKAKSTSSPTSRKANANNADDDDDSEDDEGGDGDGDEFDDDFSDDDGELGGGADDMDMDTNNVIQRLAKKAQALYGDDEDESDEDDDELDENQLEDFEASSVIDKVNVWSMLAPVLTAAGAAGELVGKTSTLAAMFEQLNQLTDQVVQLSAPQKK